MVTRTGAIEEMRKIAAEYGSSLRVYLSKDVLTGPILAQGGSQEVFPANPQGCYLGFIDQVPMATWGHPVTYVSISDAGVVRKDEHMPPRSIRKLECISNLMKET